MEAPVPHNLNFSLKKKKRKNKVTKLPKFNVFQKILFKMFPHWFLFIFFESIVKYCLKDLCIFFFLFLMQMNPFRDRLCSVFSNDKDYMNFEEFLDMMSVLSSNAPKDLKAHYAFNVYGLFDISLSIKLSASLIRSTDFEKWVKLKTCQYLLACVYIYIYQSLKLMSRPPGLV